MNARRAAALGALLAFAAPAAALPERPNLLVVCMNCANKFRTSLYGPAKGTTPGLETLAAGAWVFHNTVSPTTWTPPAVRELLNMRPNEPEYLARQPQPWQPHTDPLEETAAGRALKPLGYHLGYLSFPNAAFPPEPFFAFHHPGTLHYPYDRLFLLESALTGEARRRYRGAVEELTRFALTDDGPAPPDPFLMVGFGHNAGRFRAANGPLWDDLAAAAAEEAASPRRRLLEAALPAGLLARVKAAGRDLARDEKARVVDAINAAIERRDPVFARLLPETAVRAEGQIRFRGQILPRAVPFSTAALAAVRQGLLVPDAGGRLAARPGRLERADEERLRLVHRDLIDRLFPLIQEIEFNAGSASFRDAVARWSAEPDHAAEAALLRDLYDENMKSLDAGVAALARRLETEGLRERTVLVVVGDHGEAFMEHGRIEHGNVQCHEEVVSPPLLIRAPDGPAGRTDVREQVRLRDVLPTAFDLMGLPWHEHAGPVDGLSFAARLRGGSAPDVPTAFSRNVRDAVSARTDGGWKLVYDYAQDRKFLYDLKADPFETRNLLEARPDVAAALEEELRTHMINVRPREGPPGAR